MSSRQALLTTYLSQNPVWVQMMEVFEEVMGDDATKAAYALASIRDLLQRPDAPGRLQSFADYKMPDRKTLVHMCSMLGFNYPNIDDSKFSTEDYLRIAQNIGDYYREQGTGAFLRFFSYCLQFKFDLASMWTNDYKTFLPENIALLLGDSLLDGTGDWYPTSHVRFVAPWGRQEKDPTDFKDFFNYIAPINLVLIGTLYLDRSYLDLHIGMASRRRIVGRTLAPQTNVLSLSFASRTRVSHPTASI